MIFLSDLEKPNKFNWVDKTVDRGRQKEGTSLKSLPPKIKTLLFFQRYCFYSKESTIFQGIRRLKFSKRDKLENGELFKLEKQTEQHGLSSHKGAVGIKEG